MLSSPERDGVLGEVIGASEHLRALPSVEFPDRRQPVDVVGAGPHAPPGSVSGGREPAARVGRCLAAMRPLQIVVVDEGPASRWLDVEAWRAVAGLGHRFHRWEGSDR